LRHQSWLDGHCLEDQRAMLAATTSRILPRRDDLQRALLSAATLRQALACRNCLRRRLFILRGGFALMNRGRSLLRDRGEISP